MAENTLSVYFPSNRRGRHGLVSPENTQLPAQLMRVGSKGALVIWLQFWMNWAWILACSIFYANSTCLWVPWKLLMPFMHYVRITYLVAKYFDLNHQSIIPCGSGCQHQYLFQNFTHTFWLLKTSSNQSFYWTCTLWPLKHSYTFISWATVFIVLPRYWINMRLKKILNIKKLNGGQHELLKC